MTRPLYPIDGYTRALPARAQRDADAICDPREDVADCSRGSGVILWLAVALALQGITGLALFLCTAGGAS